MITVLTKKNCFHFNLTTRTEETNFCIDLSRLRREKLVKQIVVAAQIKIVGVFGELLERTKLYKFKPINVVEIIYSGRVYFEDDGEAVNNLIKEVNRNGKTRN